VEDSKKNLEVYNVASEDWITVNDVANEVINIVGLNNIRKGYKPKLHGVGWLGDTKKSSLIIERLKSLAFKPAMKSRDAIRTATKKPIEESKGS